MVDQIADIYDERRVAAISGEIREAIDSAMLGTASWNLVPEVLGGAFPGSMCGLLNQNVAENSLNYLAVHNISPEYRLSFLQHYAALNPWAEFWQRIESSTVMVAERDCPAHLFAHTEFYNDWLRPQDADGSVGIKIYGSPREVIHLPIHYPLSKADKYDPAAAEVLKRVRNNLVRSMDFCRLLRRRTEDAMAGSALVERAGHAALVIDSDRGLRDANQQAVDMLAGSSTLFIRHRAVCLGEAGADRKFRNSVSDISRGISTGLRQLYFCSAERHLHVLLAAIPAPATRDLPLIGPRPLILVIVKDLDAPPRGPSDLSSVAERFKLTRGELLLCERLLRGDSLAQAASVLGIRVPTARDRVKMVFHKTGTHRQGELVAMLANMALSH